MQKWHVIYTKPRKEEMVEVQLADRGLQTYFPFIQIERGYGRGVRREPFFPCYLFVYVDLQSAEATGFRWLPGVRSILHAAGQPASVPEVVIEELRRRLRPHANKVMRKGEWLFKQGQRVLVTGGPMEGFEAVFQKGLRGPDRVQIMLRLLGTWTYADIDVNLLKPLSNSNPAL